MWNKQKILGAIIKLRFSKKHEWKNKQINEHKQKKTKTKSQFLV